MSPAAREIPSQFKALVNQAVINIYVLQDIEVPVALAEEVNQEYDEWIRQWEAGVR